MPSHHSLLPRRALALVVATATAVLGLGALTAAPAAAATDPTYNVVDRPATAVTADALPTVQIDGVVWDQAIYRDTVFAGGQFNNARPAGAAAGTNQTPRSNLLAYNIRTGVLITTFAPSVNGTIKTMAVSGDGTRLYIGGTFTSVNGVTRNRLAAVNVSDGSLVSTFAPTVSNQVNAISLATVGGSEYVYFGGTFGSVNGVGRNQLAAVDATGKLRDWRPVANSTVNSLTRTPDGKSIIIGGMFATINGIQSSGLASVDSTTGVVFEDFAANKVIKDYGDKAGIYSLKTDGTNVYGTGYWFGGTAGNFEGPFVIDPYTGDIKWMADCHGDTYDTSVVGTTVYSVSHHHDCANINGFPDTDPRSWHRSNAFTLAATTTVGPNRSGGYADFNGKPAPSLVNWFPDVAAGTFTGQAQGGWTSESTSEYLVQGGEFPSVNGTAQQGLVRFAVPTIAPNKQGARVSAADSKPTVRPISGNYVRVSWPANWDRDDQSLTYKLYRTDKPTTPLSTQTATSQFWNRPVLSYLDSGLSPSTAYGYYVVVSDSAPTPNTLKSSTSTVTTGTNTIDSSAYSQAVTADGASHYWRLDDAAGAPSATDFAGANDLVLGSGAALGAAGAISGSDDAAATFDGTPNGTAGTTRTEPGTDTFTIEAWFKSTSTSGGKIVGFGDSQLGTSNNYDRHIYLDNSGRVVAGVCCSRGVSTVASDNSYTDGAWHQVVASLSDAGLKLYVDGLQEGADASVTMAQPYAGYWRVGGDNLNAWPYDHSSSFVSSSVDDVAVYPTALTLTQVRDHYTKSGRTAAVVTAPTDPYGKAVYEDNPSLFWRLDEQGGTTVKDSSPNRVTGDAFNGVTFGAASTVSPGTAASFDGSDDTVSSRKQFSNPTTYSEEVWFNTTTAGGGKLIGFGNVRSGNSGSYDRHIYMENSGQLSYGVYTGQLNVVTSPSSYNDGRWHQVVATQDGTDGMKLYVDGALVGTNGQTQAQGYDGYWRVGGDNSWAANPYFAGTIDEAAVYPTALSATKVRSHYVASPAAVNAAPVASFQSTCTDDTCSVDATDSSDAEGSIASYAWEFGDGGTASTKTASHTYQVTGDYTITLTVTDDGGKTDKTTRSVHVTVANPPPVAAFASSCTDLDCAFDASASTDANGTVASYAWDFGDANTGTGVKPSHTFAAGSYDVVLTVTDDQGATDSVTHSVTVKAANKLPTAAFASTVTGLKVSVDASTSSDPDGTVASYAWTYGDGGTGTGRTDTHTYAAAGSYTVKLVVTDNDGGTDSTTKSVSVTAPVTSVASDNFSRTGSRWGTADSGGTWSDTTSFTTNGSSGIVTLPRAGAGPVASLNAVSVLNSSTKIDFAFDKPTTGTGGSYMILSSRRSGTNEVRLKARVMADGSVRLSAWTVVGGVETVSGKETVVAGLSYTPGDVLRMRFDVSGTGTTTLSGKVWSAAAAEPASFPLVTTTTVAQVQSAGSVAVQGYISSSATNAPVVVTVDNYLVIATP